MRHVCQETTVLSVTPPSINETDRLFVVVKGPASLNPFALTVFFL